MAGRPSTYNPDYCASVLAFGEKGMSVNEMAAELGHARSSLYKWAEEHPEFSDALKRAQEKALAWWENQGRLNLTEDQDGGKFNHVLWYMNMKNRHGWADKQDVNVKHTVDIADRLQRGIERALSGQSGEASGHDS